MALLPGAAARRALLVASRPGRALGRGGAAGGPARRRLAARRSGRAAAAGHARPGLGAGRLPLHPLPPRRAPSGRGSCCPRAPGSRARCASPRRPGTRATWSTRPPTISGRRELADAVVEVAGALRRRVPGHRRRRAARGQLPGRPRRRPRQRPRAAPDRPALGRSGGAQGDAGRQGRVLRHGRARHQAVEQHAADEEGHGRRRADAGAGPLRHGAGPAGAAAPPDPGGREQHRRRRVPAGRRAHHAQRHHGRDHQHRRRGPADPGRRAGRRRRRGAGAAARRRHAHRRRPGRGRARSCRPCSRPTTRWPTICCGRARRSSTRCGGCRCTRPISAT